MAKYNEILVGRFNRALQKLSGIKGVVPSPQLASDIQPVIPFEGLNSVELRNLNSWDLFSTFFSQVAVAAQVGRIQLRNPTGSNMLAVFERIYVFTFVAAGDQPQLLLGPLTTDLATVNTMTNVNLDSRGRQSATLISSQQAAAGGGSAGAFTGKAEIAYTATIASGDFITYENQEIPLLPGSAIQIASNTVNQNVSVWVRWRERFLEEPERF